MQVIRVLHHHAPGYGWSFDSPDVPGLIGGTDAYDEKHAEEAAKFTLTCIAEEQGLPTPKHLKYEHDSERMKGMLESLGYSEAPQRSEADLILFNTCSIRESADSRFIAHLGE